MDSKKLNELLRIRKQAILCLDGFVDTREYNARRLMVNTKKFEENKLILREIAGLIGAAIIHGSIISSTVVVTKKVTNNIALNNARKIETEIYFEEISSYDVMIEKTTNFLKKINFTSALDCCNFIQLMLWNGDFSVGHKYDYCYSLEVKEAEQFMGMTVTTGEGVCRNNSDFLRDVMVALGYEAYSISNSMYDTDENKVDYDNHKYTLIYDEGKYFIFDLTNRVVLEFENICFTKDIDSGRLKANLNLLDNWINDRIDAKNVIRLIIDTLINSEEYNSEDIKQSILQSYEKYLANQKEIAAFHDEILPYLQVISSGLTEKHEINKSSSELYDNISEDSKKR